MTAAGVHNSPNSLAAKLTMRRHVLEQVKPARVFDAYCGPVGEMWAAVWRDAAYYVGCDREWRIEDARRRYAADTLLVLQSVDLAAFNVFDVDAFGDPWPAAVAMLRRRWTKGEVGALCVTDGSSMKTRWGGVSGAQQDLLGFTSKSCPPSASTSDATHDLCLTRWLARAGVKTLRRYTARSAPRFD